MNIFKIKSSVTAFLVMLSFVACSENEELSTSSQMEEKFSTNGKKELDFTNFKLSLDSGWFFQSTPDYLLPEAKDLIISTFYLKNTDLNELIAKLTQELFTEWQEEDSREKEFGEEVLLGFNINIKDDLINVYPIVGITPISDTEDDKICGGQDGDGWKNFGTCRSQTCVREKMEEATLELSEGLKSGQCVDIRIKRNALSANVCGRVISC